MACNSFPLLKVKPTPMIMLGQIGTRNILLQVGRATFLIFPVYPEQILNSRMQ